MNGLIEHRRKLEEELLTQLVDARTAMREALPEAEPEARRRFARALGRFTSLVLDQEALEAADLSW